MRHEYQYPDPSVALSVIKQKFDIAANWKKCIFAAGNSNVRQVVMGITFDGIRTGSFSNRPRHD